MRETSCITPVCVGTALCAYVPHCLRVYPTVCLYPTMCVCTPLCACVLLCTCLYTLFIPVATFSLHEPRPFYKSHQLPCSLDPEACLYARMHDCGESQSCICPPAVVLTPSTKRHLLHICVPYCIPALCSYAEIVPELLRDDHGDSALSTWPPSLPKVRSHALTCLSRRMWKGPAETLDQLWGVVRAEYRRGREAWIQSPSISCGNINMSSFTITLRNLPNLP